VEPVGAILAAGDVVDSLAEVVVVDIVEVEMVVCK
jgi:hypothetical protein